MGQSPVSKSLVHHGVHLAVLAVLLLVAGWTTTPARADGPESVCTEAARLTEAGFPQRALALIDEFDTSLPDGTAPRCVAQRSQALAWKHRSVELAGLAQQVRQSATPAPGTISASVSGCLPGTEPDARDQDALVAAALACDRDNASLAAPKSDTSPPPMPTRLGETWQKQVLDFFSPLKDIALGVVIWFAAAFLLVKLAPSVLRNRGLTRGPVGGREGLYGGISLVAVGALVAVLGLLGRAPRVWLVVGIVASLVGVMLWSRWRRGQKKLAVVVEGNDAAAQETDLRGIISDLAASSPRGLDMPVGLDGKVLEEVDFTILGGTPWVNSLKALVHLVKPYSPWQLRVNIVSEDRLVAVLLRNHEAVERAYIDRARLRLEVDSDGDTASLWPFPAALTVATIAREHDELASLEGATNWRSIGLYHLATTQFQGNKDAERRAEDRLKLLGWAVDLDPGNRLARFAFWSTLYRHAKDREDLTRYRQNLETLLAEPALSPSLELRALYARLAVLINLAYTYESLDALPGEIPGATVRAFAEYQGYVESQPAGDPGQPGAEELVAQAKALLPSLRRSRDNIAFAPPYLPVPVGPGPRANYSAACCLVRLEGVPDAATVTDVLGHLAVADGSPDLRQWRADDPQLKKVRDTAAYRDRYGKVVPTDLLSIAPFKDHAMTLRGLGLTTWRAMAGSRELNLPGITAESRSSILAAARLAGKVSASGLDTWLVPVTEFLFVSGITSPDDVTNDQRVELEKKLEPFASRPSSEHLDTAFPASVAS